MTDGCLKVCGPYRDAPAPGFVDGLNRAFACTRIVTFCPGSGNTRTLCRTPDRPSRQRSRLLMLFRCESHCSSNLNFKRLLALLVGKRVRGSPVWFSVSDTSEVKDELEIFPSALSKRFQSEPCLTTNPVALSAIPWSGPVAIQSISPDSVETRTYPAGETRVQRCHEKEHRRTIPGSGENCRCGIWRSVQCRPGCWPPDCATKHNSNHFQQQMIASPIIRGSVKSQKRERNSKSPFFITLLTLFRTEKQGV